MGSFLSPALRRAPHFFELPAHESVTENQKYLPAKLHKVDLRFCKSIFQQGKRSRKERDKFGYRHNWSNIVAEFKKKYPQWTPKDFFRLYLLDYNDFNTALDFFQEDSSPEHRRAMFDSVDTHHYNSINFKEYLQLMKDNNIGTPVPRAPKTEDNKHPACLDIISDVENADPFIDMSYRVF